MSMLGVTSPPVQSPEAPAPKAPRNMRKTIVIVSLIVLAAVIGAVAAGSSKKPAAAATPQGSTPGITDTTSDTASTDTSVAVPAPIYSPKPSQFALRVKTLSKQCFGSAGCIVTYRIVPTYSGPDLDPNSTYEVTYKVVGDESGPQINTFTISEGTKSEVDAEEMASTSSSRTVVKATPTEVSVQ
jgi:hypothetical protein